MQPVIKPFKGTDCSIVLLQYAAVATQIGTAARAEAPVRALKAISPNITKKRLPKPEPRYAFVACFTACFALLFSKSQMLHGHCMDLKRQLGAQDARVATHSALMKNSH